MEENSGIKHEYIIEEPIIYRLLQKESEGAVTHEEALTEMVNVLAEENIGYKRRLKEILMNVPIRYLVGEKR